MATEEDNDISIESTYQREVPRAAAGADTEELSALTGEVRDSKAKPYAAKVTKVGATQYIGTITDFQGELKSNDEKLAAM